MRAWHSVGFQGNVLYFSFPLRWIFKWSFLGADVRTLRRFIHEGLSLLCGLLPSIKRGLISLPLVSHSSWWAMLLGFSLEGKNGIISLILELSWSFLAGSPGIGNHPTYVVEPNSQLWHLLQMKSDCRSLENFRPEGAIVSESIILRIS